MGLGDSWRGRPSGPSSSTPPSREPTSHTALKPPTASTPPRPSLSPRTVPPGRLVADGSSPSVFAGRIVRRLVGGSLVIDLRGAESMRDVVELTVLDTVRVELWQAGAPSRLVMWVVPAGALGRWADDCEPLITALTPYASLRDVHGHLARNAFVVAGRSEPTPALFFRLRELGFALYRIRNEDPAPVQEVLRDDGVIEPGVSADTTGTFKPVR